MDEEVEATGTASSEVGVETMEEACVRTLTRLSTALTNLPTKETWEVVLAGSAVV